MKKLKRLTWLSILLLAGLSPASAFLKRGNTTPGQIATGPVQPPDYSSCNFNLPTTFNHVWYFDPIHGQTENTYTAAHISLDPNVSPHQGDITHPWKDLSAVAVSQFNACCVIGGYPNALIAPTGPIQGGDEILLQSGANTDYKEISMGTNGLLFNQNGPYLTIKPAPGATVTLQSLKIIAVNNLAFSGINVQSICTDNNGNPLPVSAQTKCTTQSGQLISVGAHNDVFDRMTLSGTDLATSDQWSQSQWGLPPTGIKFDTGTCFILSNSHIFNVGTGIQFTRATQGKIINVEVNRLGADAIDFTGQDLTFTGNYLHDFVTVGNGDHVDAFQGQGGVAVKPNNRMLIADNTIYNQVDPNLPFPTGNAYNSGIGWGGSDGWANMAVINNKIVWPGAEHGISLDHTTNAIIENNSLMNAFIATYGGDLTTMPKGDANVTIKNNLTMGLDCKNLGNPGEVGVSMQNNILYKGGNGFNIICYGGSFVKQVGQPGVYIGGNIIDNFGVLGEVTAFDLATFDFNFSLLSTAQAKGAGIAVDFSPAVDSVGRALNSPPDIGAVAFAGAPTTTHYFYAAVSPGVEAASLPYPAGVYVYNIDTGHIWVKTIPFPSSAATVLSIRGIMADPASNTLYISYYGSSSQQNIGHLLAMNLGGPNAGAEKWIMNFFPNNTQGNGLQNSGVDRGCLTPDGKTVYLPTGETVTSSLSWWYQIDVSQNPPKVIKQIPFSKSGDPNFVSPGNVGGSHNTICGKDGFVYMSAVGVIGQTNTNNGLSLKIYNPATNTEQFIGPFADRIRPFTISGGGSEVFPNLEDHVGFARGIVASNSLTEYSPGGGYVEPIPGNHNPSHGIAFTHDKAFIWVPDANQEASPPAQPPAPRHGVHLWARNTTTDVLSWVGYLQTGPSPPYFTNGFVGPGWLMGTIDNTNAQGKQFLYLETGEILDTTKNTASTLSQAVVGHLMAGTTGQILASKYGLEVDFSGDINTGTPIRAGDQFVIGQ